MTEDSEYLTPEYARAYLEKADGLPHRSEGEAVILELLPMTTKRILDLGTGDGRLLGIVARAFPDVAGVGVDFSPTMLESARKRFAGGERFTVARHDLNESLLGLGRFDAVVSSFAVHHLGDERKRSLYAEVFCMLEPGGVFCNLEHVASPTPALHDAFYLAIGATPDHEDPSNRCIDAGTQLRWLEEIGFRDVDCYWKRREFALLAGKKEGAAH